MACGRDAQDAFLKATLSLLHVKKQEAELCRVFLDAAIHNERSPTARLLQIRLKDALEQIRQEEQTKAWTVFNQEQSKDPQDKLDRAKLEKELGL